MHFNFGTWPSIPNVPPKWQVIFWRSWKGLRWHRWTGSYAAILRGSLILGWVEFRVWRRPRLDTTVTYPEVER